MSQLNIQQYPGASSSVQDSSSFGYLNSSASSSVSAFNFKAPQQNSHANNQHTTRPNGPSKNPSTTSLVTSLQPASSLPSPVSHVLTNTTSNTLIGMPTNGGPMPIASLVSNRPADGSESLFQICLALKERLELVPGLQVYLDACETDFEDGNAYDQSGNNANGTTAVAAAGSAATGLGLGLSTNIGGHDRIASRASSNMTSPYLSGSGDFSGNGSPASTLKSPPMGSGSGFAPQLNTVAAVPPGMKIDPVTHVWRFLRMGTSLCALYNALNPPTPLPAGVSNDLKVAKRALYAFIQACKSELEYSDDQLFTISNVYSESTSVLIKVIKTVQLILDTLEQKGVIPPLPVRESVEPKEMDQRAKIVDELLQTERKYVQDLEVLAKYQDEIQQNSLLSPDTLHFLFPNLFQLLDFQRQFLVAVEYHASLPPEEQRLGYLFEVSESGFEVYEGYAMNQRHASELAALEAPKLISLTHMIEPAYELPAMLIKPIQRICKYPLLLRELIKCTPSDWPYYDELQSGLIKVRKITANVNETQRRVENVEVVKELSDRLRDWRGHNIEDFGDLLHDGVFPVVKVGFEREYHLYLFENIILCCKEAAPAKKSMGLTKKNKSKRSSLVLKGRIYIAYITDVFISKKDGYLLHISWGKDDASDTGYFDIRFRNEELLRLWEKTIRKLVARYQDTANELFQSARFDGREEPNHTAYDEGSDDETVGYAEGVSPSGSEVNSTRTVSTSSNYTFSNGNNYNSTNLSEDFNNLGLSSTLTSSSTSSSALPSSTNLSSNASSAAAAAAAAAAQPLRYVSRSRSASSPNYPNYPNSSTTSLNHADKQQIALGSHATTSLSSPSSNHQANSGVPLAQRTKSEGAIPGLGPAKPHTNQMKVKLHYLEDTFLLIVPVGVKYSQLLERVDRKIRLCGKQTPNPLRIKYKDEDDDFVTITSDEDIQMALELNDEQEKNFNDTLTIWAA
ncbi:Rho family guanine nucleotide exchange factor CDC24 [Sugiyamaella lignohabitans]|uniref:Rho family guanine nucleotide exchange factor CDC24 n=1 Tax=Sugiyamaella lignohabitans TaxID=796027 RepID=A0A167FRH5_9ASCO|nr:Rho family guanine nucleotide exchange factor CDC24 [Sugiyamaella lignohabitans]ANB15608.1 Rho family guanine nucleotide exchange factor CDC24 [Sugiyamaella lignohabitans]